MTAGLGASILLDPGGFANVSRAPGRYTISAQAPGFLPWTGNVSLTSFAQLVRVNLTPVAAPGGSGGGLLAGSGGEYLVVGAVLVAAAAGSAVAVARHRRSVAREVRAPDPVPETTLGESEASGPEPPGPGPG